MLFNLSDTTFFILTISAIAVVMLLQVYILLIVNSLYNKFKEEQLRGEHEPLIV